jgi:hypothetical protein
MNVDLAQELLNELGSSLENLQTQQAALLQFVKDDGIVTDDQLAPYLEQAAKVSEVRWRAARIRLGPLISKERQREEQLAEKEQHKADDAPKAPIQNQEKPDQGKQDRGAQDQGNEKREKENQGKNAKSNNNQGSGDAVPKREEAIANATMEGAGVQSVAEKNSQRVARQRNKPAAGIERP